MSAAKKTKEVKEPTTPREILAQAIEDWTLSSEKVREYPAIIDNARNVMAEARRKYNLALGYLEEVKQSRADKLIREASGGDPPAHEIFIRQARNKMTECEDNLDAAKSALETLERQFAEWKAVEKNDRILMEKAVDAVLVAEIDTARLVQEAEELQRELEARRVALRYLYINVLPGSRQDPRKELVSSYLQRKDRLLPGLDNDYDTVKHPTNDIWNKAREALMVDADATLPTAPVPVN